MHIVLDTFTALEFWLSDLAPKHVGPLSEHPQLTSFDYGTFTSLTASIVSADGLPGPIHLLVQEKSERRRNQTIVSNAWGAAPIPPNALCEIGPGILTVSPEFCLLRIASFVTRLELYRIISDFMGIYCLSNANRIDLVKRKPLVTPQSLEAFLAHASGLRGVNAVQSALSWIRPCSASPRETSMDLMLALPTRAGGMGLPMFDANAEIVLTQEAALLTKKKLLIGDAVYGIHHDRPTEPPDGPILEYNSNKYHDTEEQQIMDFEKITALKSMGMSVVPISVEQFNSYDSFAEIASIVRKDLGIRGWLKPERRGSVDSMRSSTHAELLRIERRNRELPNLADTARWQFLASQLDREDAH